MPSEFPSFRRLHNIPLFVYNYILFIHSSTNGYLDCFCLLAVINIAAMNMNVHTSVQVPAFNSFREYISKHHFKADKFCLSKY